MVSCKEIIGFTPRLSEDERKDKYSSLKSGCGISRV